VEEAMLEERGGLAPDVLVYELIAEHRRAVR